MTTGRIDDQTVAATFRTALQFDLLTLGRLVAWADSEILNRNTVPGWILELSLAELAPAGALDAVLKEAADGADDEIVFKTLCALVPRSDVLDLESGDRLAKLLKNIARSTLRDGRLDHRVCRFDQLEEMIWLAQNEGVADQYWAETLIELDATHAEYAKAEHLEEIFGTTA